MGATVKLDPQNAAKSLAVRVRNLIQAEAYIRDTYPRYAGLKTFEAELDKIGIGKVVRRIADIKE